METESNCDVFWVEGNSDGTCRVIHVRKEDMANARFNFDTHSSELDRIEFGDASDSKMV